MNTINRKASRDLMLSLARAAGKKGYTRVSKYLLDRFEREHLGAIRQLIEDLPDEGKTIT